MSTLPSKQYNDADLREWMRETAGGRCYACGWGLTPAPSTGCCLFNCSFRPHESDSTYRHWKERAHKQEAMRVALVKGGSSETEVGVPVCIEVGNWYSEYECPRCKVRWVQNDDAPTHKHTCAPAQKALACTCPVPSSKPNDSHRAECPVVQPLERASDEIRDLACCDTFVRESASEFCATCGYTNLDHLRKRSSQGKPE